MTAVLTFLERNPRDRTHGSALLIGDILLSGPSDKSDLMLPTIGPLENVFPSGSGWTPTRFAQKLISFGDRFAAGWSGPALAAKEFFGALLELHQSERLDGTSLSTAIRDLDNSEIGRELKVSMILAHENRLNLLTNGTCADIPPLEGVAALGSGAANMLAALKRSVERSKGPLPDGTYSLARLAELMGILYEREIRNPMAIADYYGGGYEAIHKTVDGFTRLDRVLQIFLTARVESGRVAICPPHRVIIQRYEDDVMLITSYRCGDVSWASEDDGLGIAHENFAVAVPPIYRTPTAAEAPRLRTAAWAPIEQQFLFVHLHVFAPERDDFRHYFSMANNESRGHVVVAPTTDGLNVDLHNDLLRNLEIQAERICERQGWLR